MTDEQALKHIAANMRRFRELSGKSMGQLGREIGAYSATIERIENEKNMPGVGLLTRIAEALEVTVNDLLAKPKLAAPKQILEKAS